MNLRNPAALLLGAALTAALTGCADTPASDTAAVPRTVERGCQDTAAVLYPEWTAEQILEACADGQL